MNRECKVVGVVVPESIQPIIDELAGADVIKKSVLASIVTSKEFKDELIQSKVELDENGDIKDKRKKNTFKKALNNAYLRKTKDLENTASKEQGESIWNFSSGKAFAEAQLHMVYVINKLHRENALRPKDQRWSEEQILKTAIQNITTYYHTVVVESLYNVLIQDESTYDVAEEFMRKINNYHNKLQAFHQIRRTYNEQIEEHNLLIDQYEFEENERAIEAIESRLDALEESIAKNEADMAALKKELVTEKDEEGNVLSIGLNDSIISVIDNFVSKYGTIQAKNYQNLVSLVRNEDINVDWFKAVIMHPKLAGIARDYKTALNTRESALETSVDLDDVNITEQERNLDNDIHDTGWDRDIKDFIKAVNGTIRAYFNNLPQLLNNSVNDNGSYNYDTLNTIGAIIPADGNLLLSQVMVRASYTSLESFIQSIERLSNIKGLESLIVFAQDLKKDKEFAAEAFTQLRKPIIKKAIVNVLNSGISITQSNLGINGVVVNTLKMVNDYKITHSSAIDTSDETEIDQLIVEISKLGTIRNVESKTYGHNRQIYDRALASMINIIRRYCPSISESAIYNSLHNTNNNLSDNYIKLLNITKAFLEAAKETDAKIAKADNAFKAAYYSYMQALKEPLPPGGKRPKVPISTITEKTYSEIWKVATRIAEFIDEANITNLRLNSSNAKGNMSSDAIHNSKITNLMNKIQDYYINGKGELIYPQLELLKEEIVKRPYYNYSQIFYGIPGTNIEGLFIRKSDGSVIVNPNAKDVLDFYLFDGAINRASNASALYGNMFKGDYFLCMMAAFNNNENTDNAPLNRTSSIEKRAGYFLRVPSDAGKNFIAFSQKLSYAGLLKEDESQIQEYFTTYKQNLEKTLTANKTLQQADDSFGTETNKNNEITAEQVFELIRKQTFEGNDWIEKPINVTMGKGFTNTKASIILYYGEGANRVELHLSATRYSIDPYAKTYGYRQLKLNKVVTPKGELPRQLFRDFKDTIISEGLADHTIPSVVNPNHPIVAAFIQHIKGELNLFFSQLNVMFDVKGTNELRTTTDGLFDYMHHQKGKIVDSDGKLLGNAFNFMKLRGVEGINIKELIENALFLYGEATTSLIGKDGKINLNHELIDTAYLESTGKIRLKDGNSLTEKLKPIVAQWLRQYINVIDKNTAQFQSVNDGRYSIDNIRECIINTYLVNMMYDDILEGNSKYYKDAKTLLKRAKENQMGGTSYMGFDLYSGDNITLKEFDDIAVMDGILEVENALDGNDKTRLRRRNGFRAITIYNTDQASKNSETIYNDVYNTLIKKGISEKVAKKIANNIAEPFRKESCINDAQSFITLPEFIRRRAADGTLYQYVDVIRKLMDPNVPLSEITVDDVEKIQVCKNVYYDIAYDPITELDYPRQIKNAEYVLIPRLIAGTDLEQLNEICLRNDIGQVNTFETSKAANKQPLEYFGKNDSNYINPNFEEELLASKDAVQVYYYEYLYKQLDVHEHSKDKTNKVGIQMLKKLIDNYHTASPETKKHIDSLMDKYSMQIQESFNELVDDMDWVFKDGRLVNKSKPNETLKFNEYYERLKEECARLGLDSNFLDYVTLDETDNPIMPNYMSLVSVKFENIIQSLFNSYITRQTLPGWHGVQVTSVGISKSLRYHPEKRDEKGNIIAEGYIEVLLPRWSKLIPKYIPTERKEGEHIEVYNERIEKERQEFDDKLLKQLGEEGLLIQLGYRIPTEGKQSISAIKIVGFVDDTQGSTIILPEEWVAQTGADFDVDSVYGICHEIYIDRTGKVRKFVFDNDTTEEGIKRRYINYIRRRVKESRRINADVVQRDEISKKYKELKEKLKLESPLNKDSETYNNLKEEVQALRKSLPQYIRDHIKQLIKNNLSQKIDDLVTNAEIIEYLNSQIEESGNKLLKNVIQQHNEKLQEVSDMIALHRDYLDKDIYGEARSTLVKESRERLFNTIVNIGEEAGLISYEEFKELPLFLQNGKEARNNEIVNDMIAIMQHSDSHEENYSRSNFDDMTTANALIDQIVGRDKIEVSYYDPLDQIQNFENAIYGRQLKGLSVTRDNFLSLCNKGLAQISDKYKVIVTYDLNEVDKDGNHFLDLEIMEECYDVQKSDVNGNLVTVVHQNLGWSRTNRNVTGKLLTPYSSQTSAQTFDIIKEGSIPNINTYTFPVFKTLIDLGIDYYTAILFIRQPGITEIIKAYSEGASIFLDKSSNAIDTAIKRLCVQAGLVKETDSIQTALNKAKLEEVYDDITLKLSVPDLKKGLTADMTNIGNIRSQLYTIMKFKKLLTLANRLDKNIKISNPDKFGAKQTVYSTKEVIKAVNELRQEDTPILTAVNAHGQRVKFVDALYPKENANSIKVKDSFYPYMAAFMQYSTMMSAQINSMISGLEDKDTDEYWDTILKVTGAFSTDEKHQEFKKYVVNYAFAQAPFIAYPITINSDGFIGIDMSRTNEEEALIVSDLERLRVYGYNIDQHKPVIVSDIYNPTVEELNAFNQLSPAEKVLFIKENFESAPLFELISVNVPNATRGRGNTHPTLYFNEQVIDRESAYGLFRDAFYNKNKFIRLATIDLIKYAFIVEGYSFKSGAISKAIPNTTINGRVEDFGSNIVSASKEELGRIISSQSDEFIDRFVRSHKHIVRKVYVPRSNKETPTLGNIFEQFRKEGKNEFLRIPLNDNTIALLEKLAIMEYDHYNKSYITTDLEYVNINRYDTNERRYKEILYKINYYNGNFYLIPLNLLEANETSEYSVNDFNNIYEKEGSYIGFLMAIDDKVRKFTDYEFNKENVPHAPKSENVLDNDTAFDEMLNSPNKDLAAGVKKLYEGIVNYYTEARELATTFIQLNNNESLKNLHITKNGTVQLITIDGVQKPIKIVRTTGNRFKKLHKLILSKNIPLDSNIFNTTDKKLLKELNKLSPYERKVYLECIELLKYNPKLELKNIIIYEATEVNVSKELVEFESAYGTIINSPVEEMTVKSKEILALKIYNTLKNNGNIDELVGDRYVRPLLMRGLDPKSSSSLSEHLTSIYKTGLRYYQEKALMLQRASEKFECANGEYYNISEPALYEYLLNEGTEADMQNLIKLLLDSLNFGKDISMVYDLNVQGENVEITSTIEEIKRTISKIKDNVNVKYAIDKLIDDVYAAKMSTNPLVKAGLIRISEAFGDVVGLHQYLTNIAEVNNKEVQVILKEIYGKLEGAKFTIDERISDFERKYHEILRAEGRFEQDRIIDQEGKLIRVYNDDFYKDKDALHEKVKEAEETYGRHSKEYELAKLEQLEWYAENVVQEYDQQYYRDYNANLRNILTTVPDWYLKYKALVGELAQLLSNFSLLTLEDRIRIIQINREINYMSRVDSIDRETTDEGKRLEQHRKSRLQDFIEERRRINKEYFDYVEDELFEETLNRNLEIITNFDKENKYVSLTTKLLNVEYAKAYEWIQLNAYYRINDELSKKINKAFKTLNANEGIKPNKASTSANELINYVLEKAKNDPNRRVIDEYGNFHPEELTEAEIEEIKGITEALYIGTNDVTGDLEISHENDLYGALIKDVPIDQPVYKASVYNALHTFAKQTLTPKEKTEIQRELGILRSKTNRTPEESARIVELEKKLNARAGAIGRRNKVIIQINNLIKNGIDSSTGELSSELLFKNLTIAQLEELADLYDELKDFDSAEKHKRTSKLYKHKSGYYIGVKPNTKAFERELDYYQIHLANTAKGMLWRRIFTEDEHSKNLIPNYDIYGYFFISDEKGFAVSKEVSERLIDKDKTEAKKFIRETLTYDVIPEYHVQAEKARVNGRFNEWFKLNHYYNPFTHKIEPLKIWTVMKINPNSPYAESARYVQKDAVLSKKIKPSYDNVAKGIFKKEAKGRYTQYNDNTGQYHNAAYDALSAKEKAMIKLLEETIIENTRSNEAKVFFGKGYIPRLRRAVDVDAKYIAKQMFGIVGLEVAQINEEWKSEISYINDKDADFNMAQLIKGKGSKEYLKYKEHTEFETAEEYEAVEKENKKIKEENKKISEANRKIDADLLERNILSVFKEFINQSVVYNTKRELRNIAYLLQEDLKRRKGYKKGRYSGDLIKDEKLSTTTRTEYYTEDLNNALDLFNIWFRRFYYDQYKKGGNLATFASVLQNITSAKYMILNVTGGIANVGTGLVNILGESFAKDYFGINEFGEAQGLYFKALPNILANMYSDTSDNLITAIIQKFQIVNFEEMLERREGEGIDEYVQRFRNLLYGLQAGGEHYMQNTALLAMLCSHRVIETASGVEIYTYDRYINDIERLTFESIIAQNEDMRIRFNAFVNKIKNDAKLRYKYDTLKGHYVSDFIKQYTLTSGTKELLNTFVAERNKAIEKAKEEFLKYPKLIEQFELKDGKAVLKADSKVTNEMLGLFKSKVLRVNDKIHGNYSKLGAAKIEAEWWGGIAMQYHKHIYPGIMKRWSMKGMYNEFRESFEKGSYISLAQFATIEFKDMKDKIKANREEKETSLIMASLQEIFKAIVDTVTNFKMNWQLLPEYEKNNIRRTYGDLCGICGAIAMTMAIHMAVDDDTIKDSDLLSTLIYLSDRLYSESRMYTPLGLYAEASTLYSSPIAATNSIEDMLKVLDITINLMFNEDYNPVYTTGLYKGQNKALVILKRNIPAYRVYERLDNMSRNNQYYRINDNSRNIRLARNIADAIVPDKD